MTYAEVGALVEAAGSALVTLGVRSTQKCSVYGANSPEWMVAMQVGVQQSTRARSYRGSLLSALSDTPDACEHRCNFRSAHPACPT